MYLRVSGDYSDTDGMPDLQAAAGVLRMNDSITARSTRLAGPNLQKGKPMPTIKNIQARVQGKLTLKGQALRKPYNQKQRQKWGDYYIVDECDRVVSKNIDLVKLAKELGVLKPGEKVQD